MGKTAEEERSKATHLSPAVCCFPNGNKQAKIFDYVGKPAKERLRLVNI